MCVCVHGLLLLILVPVLLSQGDVILGMNKIGDADLQPLCNMPLQKVEREHGLVVFEFMKMAK